MVANHAEANAAMVETLFAARGQVPEQLEAKLREAVTFPAPVEGVWRFAETMFANRAQFSEEARQLAAPVVEYGGQSQYAFLRDGRGAAMAAALLGDEDAAPEPDQRFVITEEEAPE